MTVRRDSYASLGEHLAANPETVRRWTTGNQPPTHKALLRALDATLADLEPWQRSWWDQLTASDHAQEGAGWAGEDEQESSSTRRDEFLKAVAAFTALVPHEAVERLAHHGQRPVDSGLVAAHEAWADVLASPHSTQRADVLIGPTAQHADVLLGLLDRPMAGTDRRRLESITVSAHVQAGLLAFGASDRTTARRYFALAWNVADEAGDDTLRAQTLGVAAVLHSPIEAGGRGGDSRKAVATMRRAVHHARHADLATRGYAHRWLGLELAAAGDEQGFLTSYEAGDRLSKPQPPLDGHGFLPRYFARAIDQVSNRGIGLVRVGRADEAIQALRHMLDPSRASSTAMARADIAAAYVLSDEPEEACRQLQRALSLTLDAGYAMGVERIRGVRARFPETWAELACVAELDERLRASAR